jgi:hypothetical protein
VITLFPLCVFFLCRQGVYQFADGSKYNGEWEGGRRHGKGIYWCCNGDVYRGYWAKDCMSGQGKLCYGNGDSYEGEWQEGRHHGKGKFIHIDETSGMAERDCVRVCESV